MLPTIVLLTPQSTKPRSQASVKIVQKVPFRTDSVGVRPQASILCGTLTSNALPHGESFEFSLFFDDKARTEGRNLKYTRVYNDMPGAAIQKALNLAVTDPGTISITFTGESENDSNKQDNLVQVRLRSVSYRSSKVSAMAHKIL